MMTDGRVNLMIFASPERIPIGTVLRPGSNPLPDGSSLQMEHVLDINGAEQYEFALKVLREATEDEYMIQNVNIATTIMVMNFRRRGRPLYYYQVHGD